MFAKPSLVIQTPPRRKWPSFRLILRTCIENGLHLELLKSLPVVGKLSEVAIKFQETLFAVYHKFQDEQDEAAQHAAVLDAVRPASLPESPAPLRISELLHDLDEAITVPPIVFDHEMRSIAAQELPQGTARQQALLADIVSQMPQKARTVFMRPEDRTGQTRPPGWRLQTPEHFRQIFPTQLPQLTTGDTVPGREQWQLVSRLGDGGFGQVWLTQHAELGALRACKFFLDQESRSKLMQHEARINGLLAKQKKLSGVPALVDASLQGSIPWLMFEYVPGGNLADWVATWPREPSRRTPLALLAWRQLATTAGQFHALVPPIVHRDLKWANILRDDDELKIIDFGISDLFAVAEPESAQPTARNFGVPTPTLIRGSFTPGYASPQQRNGEPPDPRDDVYTLGVLGYQMLMGDMLAPLEIDYRDDLEGHGVPARVIDLIARCLRKDPAQRSAHGHALAAEIALLLTPESTTRPAAPGERTPTSVSLGPGGPSYQNNPQLGDTQELALPGGVTLKLIWCPPGTFTMGTPGATDNESPVQVTLTQGYWLAETATTQAQWTAVMGAASKPWCGKEYVQEGPNFPATYISHGADETIEADSATAFCMKLTKIEHAAGRLPNGWKYVLPTEAQWEYACRAGTTTAYSHSNGYDLLFQYAWYDENTWDIGEKYAHAVGTKAANPWGLLDMHGNVWEWCVDWYSEYLLGRTNPAGPTTGLNRVCRGGNWSLHAGNARSACRNMNDPSHRIYSLGFRLCLSSTWPQWMAP